MKEICWEKVGKRIRGLRTQKNLTVEELAGRIGCQPDHLRKVERGNKKLSLNLTVGISKALGTTVEYLIYGELGMEPCISAQLDALSYKVKMGHVSVVNKMHDDIFFSFTKMFNQYEKIAADQYDKDTADHTELEQDLDEIYESLLKSGREVIHIALLNHGYRYIEYESDSGKEYAQYEIKTDLQ